MHNQSIQVVPLLKVFETSQKSINQTASCGLGFLRKFLPMVSKMSSLLHYTHFPFSRCLFLPLIIGHFSPLNNTLRDHSRLLYQSSEGLIHSSGLSGPCGMPSSSSHSCLSSWWIHNPPCRPSSKSALFRKSSQIPQGWISCFNCSVLCVPTEYCSYFQFSFNLIAFIIQARSKARLDIHGTRYYLWWNDKASMKI